MKIFGYFKDLFEGILYPIKVCLDFIFNGDKTKK